MFTCKHNARLCYIALGSVIQECVRIRREALLGRLNTNAVYMPACTSPHMPHAHRVNCIVFLFASHTPCNYYPPNPCHITSYAVCIYDGKNVAQKKCHYKKPYAHASIAKPFQYDFYASLCWAQQMMQHNNEIAHVQRSDHDDNDSCGTCTRTIYINRYVRICASR